MIEYPTEFLMVTEPGDRPYRLSYSPSTENEAAFIKCMSRASQLVIRRESLVPQNDPKYYEHGYFVYHDTQIRIAMEPTVAGAAPVDDSILISFDSMGYATRPDGYRLWLMRPDANPVEAMTPTSRSSMHLKVVNVTPLGRAYLWKTLTKTEEKAYEGKEGL